MVKKLEKGSTEACIKPHQEGHKSNSGKVKGQFGEVQSTQNATVLFKAVEVPGCDSASSQYGSAAPGQNSKAPKATKVQLQPKKTHHLL